MSDISRRYYNTQASVRSVPGRRIGYKERNKRLSEHDQNARCKRLRLHNADQNGHVVRDEERCVKKGESEGVCMFHCSSGSQENEVFDEPAGI